MAAIDGIQLLLKGTTRAAVESALKAKELSVNEEAGKLELIYKLSDESDYLHFADNSLQCLLAGDQALTGHKTFSSYLTANALATFNSVLAANATIQLSTSLLDLGAGFEDYATAASNPDNVANSTEFYLHPQTEPKIMLFQKQRHNFYLFITAVRCLQILTMVIYIY